MFSQYPFQDLQIGEPIARNIFGFFNINELSTLSQVCKVWNHFIKDEIVKVTDEVQSKTTAYKSYFKLYYANGKFLLDINTSDFFTFNYLSFEEGLDPKVEKELPFIKPCYDLSFLSRFNVYFWSPDGINFHLLEEKKGSYDDTVKTIHFSTSEAEDEKNIFRIKYSPTEAILLASETQQKIMSFKKCLPKVEEWLLQFIFSGKINMIPYQNQFKPEFLFQFNQNDLLFIGNGKQGNKTVIKVRKESCWYDLRPKCILVTSDNSEAMYITFNQNSEYKRINILRQNSNDYQALIQMKDKHQFNLIKINLNEYDLSKFDFIINPKNPRQTPLDIIEKSENMSLSSNK